MIKMDFLESSSCRKVIATKGKYSLVEYEQDISVSKATATTEYFASKMNVRKKQVVCNLQNNGVILQAGAMQWISGNVDVKTDIKGVGDFAKKFIGSKVTKESAIKPLYSGTGMVVLEPTYKYILFEDVGTWSDGMIIKDSLFLACDDTVNLSVAARTNLSSAVLGGEGLFNTCLTGNGIAVLECSVARDELITIEMTEPNDVFKIDGPLAVAWSKSLNFTTEKTTKSLIGSAASGEGFVNVYRGIGKIIMSPVGIANRTSPLIAAIGGSDE